MNTNTDLINFTENSANLFSLSIGYIMSLGWNFFSVQYSLKQWRSLLHQNFKINVMSNDATTRTVEYRFWRNCCPESTCRSHHSTYCFVCKDLVLLGDSSIPKYFCLTVVPYEMHIASFLYRLQINIFFFGVCCVDHSFLLEMSTSSKQSVHIHYY